MTTGDPWIDAKIAQSAKFEYEAGRALENPVRAGMKIERVEWQEGRALIDDLHYFNVPTEAWNMQVNGWQVAKKWLVDRKDWVLSQNDITQYKNLISTLIELIGRLEKANMKHCVTETAP